MYSSFFKRIIDLIGAIFGLLILSPLFVFMTIGLFFSNQGKPFFIQVRPGKKSHLFKIIKFKTMNDKKDNLGNLLPDEFRLTNVGKFVRKTSLDEIPQLLNVIKGEMSLIGPRPLLPEYLSLYDETGWAQVNGRNAIGWRRKLEYDVWYVDNVVFLLDCKIVYLTLIKIFKREGITSENSLTTEAFKENKE